MTAPAWKGDRFAPWLLVLLVMAAYLPGAAQLPLLDRDEPRFATAAREMMDRNDWIVPTFNGNERFDKPVLVYWLMRAGYTMAGVNELGARLPGVGCMIGLVLLVWSAGKRWFGEREGFAAAFMLATSLQFLIHGRLAVADMPMVLCVAVACVAVAELMIETDDVKPGGRRRLAWWCLWISLGVGFLGKGPIALVVPALALVLWRWVFCRKPLPWARLGIGSGLCVCVGIIAIWGIPALWMTDGRFWETGIGEHVLRRGYEKFNARSYSPFFYLGTASFSLFPWIVFIGVAAMAIRRDWDARKAWLASWLLAPYVIFTAYATQLPHYVMPGFPAFFLLLGVGLTQATVPAAGRWQRVAVNTLLTVGGLALIVIFALIWRADLPANAEPLRQSLVGLMIAGGGLLVIATAWWMRRVAFAVMGVILLGAGTYYAGASLRKISPAITMQAHWRGLPADTRYLGWGFAEPSIVFYSAAKWEFPATSGALTDALAKPGPLMIIVMERECDPLGFFTGQLNWRDHPSSPVLDGTAQCLQTFEALNLGRTRWQRISVWLRLTVKKE